MYNLNIIYPVNSTNDNNVITCINYSIPKYYTCSKLLYYTENYLNTTWYNTYGGMIIEYNDTKNKATFIVLRGSHYDSEWVSDSLGVMTKPKWLNNVSVHLGFNQFYSDNTANNKPTLQNQIKNYINSSNITNLFITGHSLGSSLSALLFADITKNYPNLRKLTKCYCFALPLTGDINFVNVITNGSSNYTGFFSIINTCDPILNLHLPTYNNYSYIKAQEFCFAMSGSLYPVVTPHDIIPIYQKGVIDNRSTFDNFKGGISGNCSPSYFENFKNCIL